MADITRLRKLIRSFEFKSSPTSADRSKPCTVGEMNKLIENIASVLNAFVDELEKEE